jgi:acetyl esterase
MINPQLNAFLERWAQEWSGLPQAVGPAERRAWFEGVAARMREPMPAGVTADEGHQVPVPENGQPVRLRVFRPASAKPLPAIVYFHGGAWMMGSPQTHWDITAQVAAHAQAVVVSVDYALAPERPFPAAVHDAHAVALWLVAKAQALGVQPGRWAIGGDSAGANLAAVTCLRLLGKPQAPLAQWLVYPATDLVTMRPSHEENANGPIVTTASMPFVNKAYSPDVAQLGHPWISPLNATSHAGLPPAHVAVAEHDPLRDEGIAYAEALQAAGVPTTLDRGKGLIHGYLRGKAYCEAAEASFRRMGAWLHTQLHR